jgi:alcohol dehydrogenase class IV
MSFASIFGKMAYVQDGGLYAHSMSYILNLDNNLPQSLGCGISLPYTLMFNIDYIKPILVDIAKILDPKTEGAEEKMTLTIKIP